jgi:hypothetical protein
VSLPSEAELKWMLAVNSNYQDAMRTLVTLVTASLVLPTFLVRNFVKVPEGKTLSDVLDFSAYVSWVLMFLSLGCCMVFFWASAKYVKFVSGGGDDCWGVCEPLRDWSIRGTVLLFVAGLFTLGLFFRRHLQKH